MSKEDIVSIAAFALLLLYCVPPALFSIFLIFYVDYNNDAFKFIENVMRPGVADTTISLLGPILASVVIFRGDKLTGKIPLAMLITTILCVIICLIGIGFTQDPGRITGRLRGGPSRCRGR